MNFKMDQFMMENGKIIKCMDLAVLQTDSATNGKESLLMVFINQKYKSN